MPDIKVYQGNDWSTYILFSDKTTGSAIDITPWTVRFTVKTTKDSEPNDTNAKIKKDIGVGSHFAPTLGSTLLTLGSLDTKLGVGPYFYDLKYFNGSSVTRTITEGKFIILAPVTNR